MLVTLDEELVQGLVSAVSLPAVSRHLKVLEHAGLIRRGREAQWRPCRLEAEPLRDLAEWMEQYRAFWEERLDRLDDYLHELQATAGEQRRGRTKPSRETPRRRAPRKPQHGRTGRSRRR